MCVTKLECEFRDVKMIIFEMLNGLLTLKAKLMFKNNLFIVLIIVLISCKSSNEIMLFKDKETMDKGYSTNSIRDFSWGMKPYNVFDIKKIKARKANQLYSIINNLEKTSNSYGGISFPRYAFILDYNNKKDTLYCYDFNDKDNYENKFYLVQNDITLKDTNDELKNFLFKHYEKFIRKEYYTLPGTKKEKYWIKEDDF